MTPQWPAVARALKEDVEANATITALIGTPPDTRYRMASERKLEVDDFPMIDWQLISDADRFEVFEGILVQFAILCRTDDDLITLETELRDMWDHDAPITIGVANPVWAWAEYLVGMPLQGADDGILARSYDFRFTVYKSAYCS